MQNYLGPTALILLMFASILGGCQNQETTPPPPKVTIIHPTMQDIPIEQDFVGQVYGSSDIPIRARVDGFLEKIYFNEGTAVKKGDRLYAIEANPYNEEVAGKQSNLVEAKATLLQAESELERIEPLAKINAVSASDYDAAKSARDVAKSRVEAAEAQLRLSNINRDYTLIEAPISGIIGKSEAKIGEYVGSFPNPVILNTISEIDSIRVEFFLTEEDYLKFFRLRQGQLKKNDTAYRENDFPIQLILSDGSTFEHTGILEFINREIDPTTGTILLQAIFPNPRGLLRPGQFAKVRAVTSVVDDAMLIPQRAVTEVQGNYTVKAITDSNTVAVQPIKVATTYKDYYLITAGLKPEDKIVLDGLQKAREGVKVSPEKVEFESQAK